MTENVENLMLDHLKRFQVTLKRVDQRLDELTIRQSEKHAAVLGLRRARVDRLDRLERRLDLAN